MTGLQPRRANAVIASCRSPDSRTDGDGALADEPVHVGTGDEVTYRITDASGGRAVLRLLAKGGIGVGFGVALVGSVVYVLATGAI